MDNDYEGPSFRDVKESKMFFNFEKSGKVACPAIAVHPSYDDQRPSGFISLFVFRKQSSKLLDSVMITPFMYNSDSFYEYKLVLLVKIIRCIERQGQS